MSERWTVHEGDVRDVLPSLDSHSVDAVLSDVPYGLGSHQPTGDEIREYVRGAELDTGGDFMGHDWNVPSVAVWRELCRIAKPGAHVAAFAGSRTGDLITIGMRVGGWEIRDVLMWMHAQGFPKSLDAAKAIDKANGHWRGKAGAVASENSALGGPNYERTDKGGPITAAAAAAAAGYGSALKPAFEPITLARAPLDGTMIANLAKWGTGFLAIDACRISYASEDDKAAAAAAAAAQRLGQEHHGVGVGDYRLHTARAADSLPEYLDKQSLGRWPANVLLDEEAAALLDEQSGKSMTHGGGSRTSMGFNGGEMPYTPIARTNDFGGASRFYFTSKATKSDRDHGLAHRALVPGHERSRRAEGSAGARNARAGATGAARNAHPNVKPLDLVEWIAKLLLPPKRTDGSPRVLLVPYCGSGSEMIGALRAGWDRVVGIERDPGFAALCRDRLSHADVAHQPELFGT